MQMASVLVLLSLLAGLLSSCSYPMEEMGFFKTGGVLRGFNAGTFAQKQVDFEVLKVTALSSCLQCHSTGGGTLLNTSAEVMALKSDILATIQEGSMPPRGSGYAPLSECEKQILETFFEDASSAGGSSRKVGELSHCGNALPTKPKEAVNFATLELSWENLSKEVLGPKCLSCHTEETARRTLLDSYASLKEQDLLGSTPEESEIYAVTLPTARRFMPPKNRGIEPLTPDEQNYLKRWIEAGAPEGPAVLLPKPVL